MLFGKIQLVALLCLSSWCPVIVTVLWLLRMAPKVGLQFMIVVFLYLDHTHLLFSIAISQEAAVKVIAD